MCCRWKGQISLERVSCDSTFVDKKLKKYTCIITFICIGCHVLKMSLQTQTVKGLYSQREE